MIYPILTVICFLLRGQLSIQRNDTLIHKDLNNNSVGINGSITSCSIEELSKLLTNRLAMNRAIELATHKESKSKDKIVNNIMEFAVNKPKEFNGHTNQEELLPQDNELHRIVDNLDSPPITHSFHPIITNRFEVNSQTPNTMSPNGQRLPFKEAKDWSFESPLHAFPLFLPRRNFKPPPGAKISLEFKDKKREVIVTVSPLMTVLEALKQAEIKFQRSFKLPIEDQLIWFWWSPTLNCIIVDKISTIQNDKSLMWRLSIINNNGEIEYEDYCLPSNGEVFIKPGSTIQLVYTSFRNVKDIY